MNINLNLIFLITLNVILIIYIINIFIKKKNNIFKILIKFLNEILPTIFLIFIIKSFIYEIYYIPSSSMMPTLLIGDYILVNKLSYNIKNPINNKTILNLNNPKYGDIIVFQNPNNLKNFFIKRIIGLPNDIIIYNENKKKIKIYKYISKKKKKYYLTNIIKYSKIKKKNFILEIEKNNKKYNKIYYWNIKNIKINNINNKSIYIILNEKNEFINNIKHKILLIPNFYNKKIHKIKIWKIPKNMYFVMGDFRDNSKDSRYIGYINKNLIIGKAKYIIINFNKKLKINNFKLNIIKKIY